MSVLYIYTHIHRVSKIDCSTPWATNKIKRKIRKLINTTPVKKTDFWQHFITAGIQLSLVNYSWQTHEFLLKHKHKKAITGLFYILKLHINRFRKTGLFRNFHQIFVSWQEKKRYEVQLANWSNVLKGGYRLELGCPTNSIDKAQVNFKQ